MKYFPLLFFSIVAVLHGYMSFSLRRALRPGVWLYAALAFLAVAFLAFLFRRHIAAPYLTEGLFLWLGLLILVCLALLVHDGFQLAAWLAERIAGWRFLHFFSGQTSMRIAFAIGILAFAWSLHEAADVTVRRFTVPTQLLPDGIDRVRVAFLADLHISPYTDLSVIEEIVDLANRQQPDIIAVVGDAIDGQFAPDSPPADALRKLRAGHGKFAVLGNHELYSGTAMSVRFLESVGLRLLRGEAEETGGIVIAGVDDPQVMGRLEIAETLRNLPADRFVLLLSHRPDAPPESIGLFDVEFAGHTHGGQIWPVRYAAKILNRFGQGWTVLDAPEGAPRRQSAVYVSNGTRFWGPPVRFLTPPEITIMDIAKGE